MNRKIIIIFFAILSIFLVSFLIYKIVKNRKKSKDWSDQEVSDFAVKMYNDPSTSVPFKTDIGKVILLCMSKYISKIYSYDDAMNGKILPSDNIASISSCMGTKGSWSDNFKTLMKNVVNSGQKDTCVTCIINGLEKQLDPIDMIYKGSTIDISSMIVEITKTCDTCTQQESDN